MTYGSLMFLTPTSPHNATRKSGPLLFGNDCCRKAIVGQALHGPKWIGDAFRADLAGRMHETGYVSCPGDLTCGSKSKQTRRVGSTTRTSSVTS
eukprot:CCRYP_004873-RA/>CCRYP_004873-RA protein AED:0.41 eAED:0.54 QI:0/0/0/1/0/0/2/0/93